MKEKKNSQSFAAVAAVTGISATIAAGSGTLWTVTRGAGDWLSNGLKVGYDFF